MQNCLIQLTLTNTLLTTLVHCGRWFCTGYILQISIRQSLAWSAMFDYRHLHL